ncbi:hypothetical protein Mapa_000926 [Marchantia paleacea]|nr:hypothetical protein Mapa_000926 [Marchantia paleacea]
MEERNAELDPELWDRLPPELLEKVLAKLPLTSLLSFRAVCSQWKSMIESPRIVYEGPPGKPVLFYHHPGGPLVAGGVRLPPSLMFPNYGSKTWKRESLPFSDEKNNLVASDGGLLVFSSDYNPDTFIIYNPLSKRWREIQLPSSVLPRLPRGAIFQDPFSFMLVGLTVNRDTGVYKLLVAGIHEDGPRDALSYDSSLRDWQRCASVPPMATSLTNGEWISERGLCCGGHLYWHVYESSSNQIIKALLKYYVETNVWAVVQELTPCDLPSDFHITAHDGNILLLDWSDRDNFDENIGLSDLQSLGLEVKQLIHVENLGLVDLIYDASEGTHHPSKSIAEGECLYTVYDSLAFEDLSHKVVEYNSRTNVLTWLPPMDFIPNPYSLCAFAPSLKPLV